MIEYQGSLTRANKLILGDKSNSEGTSVFTLHHWSISRQESLDRSGARSGRSKRYKFGSNQRARLLLFKVQESALNFLFRWLLLDDFGGRRTDDIWNIETAPKCKLKTDGLDSNNTDNYVINQSKVKSKNRKRKANRSNLLLGSVPHQLPDRRLITIAKFIFWRWLTWTNVFELLLIGFLISCCALQCYSLLGEYFEYPTNVRVTKAMNDDFRKDLPAITICNKNVISKQSLRRNFPNLNESHFLAISYGTFYSVDNFTLDFGPNNTHRHMDGDEEEECDDELHIEFAGSTSHRYGSCELSPSSSSSTTNEKSSTAANNRPNIDWFKVLRFLTKRYLHRAYDVWPSYDLVDRLTCANLWGDEMPCAQLNRIKSFQQGHMCDTLFHDSVFQDSEDPAVQELEIALIKNPSKVIWGDKYGDLQMVDLYDDLYNTDDGVESGGSGSGTRRDAPAAGGQRRTELGNMEMIRMRIDFRSGDYANNRTVIGGILAIHPSSVIGTMDHIVYNIEPGYWYNYYIERFDYKRLPPPYNTHCYNYQQNRYQKKMRGTATTTNGEQTFGTWSREDRMQIMSIIKKQAAQPGEPLEDYVNYLRKRSLSGVSITQLHTIAYIEYMWYNME